MSVLLCTETRWRRSLTRARAEPRDDGVALDAVLGTRVWLAWLVLGNREEERNGQEEEEAEEERERAILLSEAVPNKKEKKNHEALKLTVGL